MITLYPILQNLPGALFITARPQVLPDDLRALKTAGIDTIISLLEPEEAAKIGLASYADSCAKLDLIFLNHPVRDMHLPDPAAFNRFTTDIAARLGAGARIAVHCYASIGRSGMLACAVTGHFGHTAASALKHVSDMRGVPVPDTAEQTAFIHNVMRGQHP